MKKKACFVDLQWWSGDSKQIVGDMYFTTQERPETLNLEVDESRKALSERVQSRFDEYEYPSKENEGFAIYEFYEVEVEDGDDEPWWGDVNLDEAILTDVFVCATKEQAAMAELEFFYQDFIDWKKQNKNFEIHYYEED